MTINRGGKNITLPCRICMPCRVNHAQEWTFRIQSEMKFAKTAHFLTLTYDDENITRNDLGYGVLVKKDFQKFLKRLRFNIKRMEDDLIKELPPNSFTRFPPVRYYLVGEYGEESYRPHGHAIIFNVPKSILEQIQQIWKHGFVKVGTVTTSSIRYVTKYITKWDSRDLDIKELTPPFNLMSLGLGGKYVNEESIEYHSRIGNSAVIRKGEQIIKLPSYYKNKVHNLEDFKTALRLHREKKEFKQFVENQEQKMIDKIISEGGDVYNHLLNEEKALLYKLSSHKRNKL
mgnify:CR=1 FL=1